MGAGRGVLRTEFAVVLHRDAAVRSASRDSGGSRVRIGHRRDVAVPRGICGGSRVGRQIQQRPRLRGRAFPVVSMEFATTHLPAIGFPWDLLGYVAAGNLVFVQLTAITGIFGLSLVVASYSALAAWVVLQMSLRKQAGLTMWIGANAMLFVIAFAGPRYVPQAPADHVAHLVQTNFPVALNYPKDWMQVHAAEMDQLEAISIGRRKKLPASSCGRKFRRRFPCRTEIFRLAPCASRAEQGTAF